MQAQPNYEEPGQAKASMEFLVRIFAKKLAKDNINVNCIIPGAIKTEAWDRAFQVSNQSPRLYSVLGRGCAAMSRLHFPHHMKASLCAFLVVVLVGWQFQLQLGLACLTFSS